MAEGGLAIFSFPPTREDFREISKLKEGELDKIPFPFILFSHFIEERTVILEVSKGRIQKKVLIEFGTPVDCQSNLAHETFGRFLSQMGKFSEEDANRFFSESIANGKPLGEYLVSKGIMNHSELYRFLQQNLAKKLLDLFLIKEGQFKLSFSDFENKSSLKVNVPQLIFTGITKFATIEEVNKFLAPLIGKILAKSVEPFVGDDEIKLNQTAQAVLKSLEKPKRLDEIVAETSIPYEDFSRILYALSLLGIVVPEERNRGKSKKVEAIKEEPKRELPSKQALSQEEIQTIREELHKDYLSFRGKDAFDLFSLQETATILQIKEAFLDFSSKYHPEKFCEKSISDLKEKATELFLAGAKAYAILSDGELKEKLKRERIEKRQRAFTSPPPSQKDLYKELLDAKTQFKTAKALRHQGKHKEALNYFEYALELDPQNSEYGAELALQRFLHSELFADKSLKELAEILKREPTCFTAWINSAFILAQRNNIDAAKKNLLNAEKLNPKDTRVAEVKEIINSKQKTFLKK